MSLLDVRALTKKFRRNDRDFSAVDAAEFTLGEGDFVCITGHSGSGKSTLLHMIVGLLSPTSGQIFFNDIDICALDDAELSALRNKQIGYIPQGHSILANLNVLDNVRLPHYLHKRSGDPTKRALELLDSVGISNLAGQYPAQLSGGELRRVSIARGLINSPRLLIADEPTGDLDPSNSEGVMNLFSQFSQNGTAVMLVTHEKENITYAGKRLHMEAGKLREV